jgi:hypothetical protein
MPYPVVSTPVDMIYEPKKLESSRYSLLDLATFLGTLISHLWDNMAVQCVCFMVTQHVSFITHTQTHTHTNKQTNTHKHSSISLCSSNYRISQQLNPLQAWEAHWVPGGWGSQISRQSAHECGKPYAPAAFTRRIYSWYSFLLQTESTPGPKCGRKVYVNEKFQWHHREWKPRPSGL